MNTQRQNLQSDIGRDQLGWVVGGTIKKKKSILCIYFFFYIIYNPVS